MADPKLSQQHIDDLKEFNKLLEKQPKFLRGLTGLWDSIKINIKDSESHVEHLSKGSKDFLDISKKVLSNTKDIHKETVDWADISKEILKAQDAGNYHLADQFKQYKKIQQGQKRYNNLVNAGSNSISKMVSNLDSGIRNIPFIGDFLADAINFDDMSKDFTKTFRQAAAVGGPAGEAISSGMSDNVSQGVIEGISSGFAEEGKWGTRIGKWFKKSNAATAAASMRKGKPGFTIDHTDLDIMKAHNTESQSYQAAAKRFGVENLSRKQAIEKVEKGSVRKLAIMRVATVGIGLALLKMATSMTKFAFETGLSLSQTYKLKGALFINKGYVKAMAEEFGTINDVNSKIAWQLKKQSFFYGIEAEQAVKILRIQSALSDSSHEQLINVQNTVAKFARAKGVLPSKVFEDIAGSTELMAKYADGTAEGFMKAAVHIRTMGIGLEVADQIASHLLDIEGSINAQFMANSVLQKNMNLDRARQLVLNNDLVGMMEEVKNQLGGELEFQRLNLVERDLLGKAIGTDISNVAKMISAQEASNEVTKQAQGNYKLLGGIIGGVVGLLVAAVPAIRTAMSGGLSFAIDAMSVARGLAVVGIGAAGGAALGSTFAKQQDFVSRPGMAPIPFSENDTLIGIKKAAGLGSSDTMIANAFMENTRALNKLEQTVSKGQAHASQQTERFIAETTKGQNKLYRGFIEG